MRSTQSALFTAIAALTLSLTGCGVTSFTTPVSSDVEVNLHGTVFGGQQPIGGATIKLYHVNVSSEKGASVSMLTGAITTGNDGSFSIAGKFTCGSATDVYLTATGGNPTPNNPNANITLMVAIGQCSTLSSTSVIKINELTTVAAAAALAPYMASPTSIGTSSSQGETNNLDARFTLAGQFVGVATGTAPGTNLPAGFSSPSTMINTVGSILAACVNSTGGVSGDGSTCGTLFNLATPPGGVAPTDTATAALNIANHPTLSTQNLFNLIPTQTPFAPSATSAPSSYALALIPPAFTVTRSLLTFPDNGFSAIYNAINNATTSIDMTMYELEDTTASGDLVSACARGVKVRVILNENTKSQNSAAYAQINAAPANCTAVYSNPQFSNTHQKSLLIDGNSLILLSANLTSQYYTTTRDFAVITNDPQDIAAVEDTFTHDYGSTTDEYYENLMGNDLIWSPTSAQVSMLQLINNATSTVTVENEEMSATNIITALENAAARGVTCNVIMTDDGSYTKQLTALKAAGCNVRTYADKTNILYIHAKVILADYGLSGQIAYMGSINFTTASMLQNRELGTILTDQAFLTGLNTAMTSDYNGGMVY